MDNKLKAICLASLLLSGVTVQAEVIAATKVAKGVRGGDSPFGETVAEAANKQVAFAWNYTNMIERNPQKSFETYVSKDYCNHGHMSTSGQRDCAGYWETYDRWVKNYSVPLKPGDQVEIPDMASVDGEMVTTYSSTVDIYHVVDGKITDHWDATPPRSLTVAAHAPEVVENMMKVLSGERKMNGPPMGAAIPAEKK